MFEVFSEFVYTAAFFALHAILVLVLIGFGLALNRVSDSYSARQRQKAFEIIHKGTKR